MKVICNQRHRCHMGDPTECGGANPHEPCNECGKCPVAKKLGAQCVEVTQEDTEPKPRKVV